MVSEQKLNQLAHSHSACTFSQSDLSFHCPHEASKYPNLLHEQLAMVCGQGRLFTCTAISKNIMLVSLSEYIPVNPTFYGDEWGLQG